MTTPPRSLPSRNPGTTHLYNMLTPIHNFDVSLTDFPPASASLTSVCAPNYQLPFLASHSLEFYRDELDGPRTVEGGIAFEVEVDADTRLDDMIRDDDMDAEENG